MLRNKKRTLLALTLVLTLAPLSLAAEGTWTSKADMPTARMFLSTSVVDGKIYAIGGSSVLEVGVSNVERYDPATDTWTTMSPMPTPRWGLSTSVVNGKIYAIGGARGFPIPGLQTVEEYDPATDTWTTMSPMPSKRWSLSTSVVDGKIYAIGGEAPTGLRTMHEYDPATDTWTQKASMTIRRYAFSASVANGKTYAIGGVTSFPSSTSIVEEYDSVADIWTRKTNMPAARTFYSTCEVYGRIYVFGGAPHPNQDPLSVVYEYDPATDTWATKTDMPTARTGHHTSEVSGKIYVIGGSEVGFTTGHRSVSTVEEYDPHPLVVDFNGDGVVDGADMSLMVDYWQTDEPFCDIAPRPFGDGIVDVQDLIALSEHLSKEVDDPTLVAHWALDETEGSAALDNVNGNDDFIMGGALWRPTGGMVDGALELDGVDDCLITVSGPNPADGPFSIFACIKGGAPGQVIISQPLGANLLALDAEDKLMTEFGSSGQNSVPLESQAVVNDGGWHRIGLVWDGSSRMLCVDGVVVAEDTPDGPGATASGLYIGIGKNYAAGTFFSGLIDDVRIYNRVVSP